MGDHQVGYDRNGDHIHRLQPWPPKRKFRRWFLALVAALQIFSCRTGAEAAQLPWMSPLFLLYNLPPTQGPQQLRVCLAGDLTKKNSHSQWGLPSWRCMCLSFCWWQNLWEVGVRRLFIISPALDVFWGNVSALLLTTKPDTFTSTCLSPFGEGNSCDLVADLIAIGLCVDRWEDLTMPFNPFI